jgi:hypothetical protein
MLDEREMNKRYWSRIIDQLEANNFLYVDDNFDKRSSVTSKGGRPYMYSPAEIRELMIKYFRNCIEHYQPFTISGLCLQLGITREGMQKMKKSPNKEIGDIIKKGRYIVEFYYEYSAQMVPNPSFQIFVLKNMGWRDKQFVETRAGVGISDEDIAKAMKRMDNFSE